MLKYGYTRVAAASPETRVADIDFNVSHIKNLISQAAGKGAEFVVFPELCITSYTCADLFYQKTLLQKAIDGAIEIIRYVDKLDICVMIGLPLLVDGALYNCALITTGASSNQLIAKTHLPNYNEFYERRWFTPMAPGFSTEVTLCDSEGDSIKIPFSADTIYSYKGVHFGVEICEDVWVPKPPCIGYCQHGAELIFNLSASPESIGKHDYLESLIRHISASCRAGYIYSSAGWGESSTDLVFSGTCLIAEDGTVLARNDRFGTSDSLILADIDIEKIRNDRLKFSTFRETSGSNPVKVVSLENINQNTTRPQLDADLRYIDAHPFVDSNSERLARRCDEILSIQARGLATRLKAINCKKVVIGISGGLDSTLALLVSVKAFDLLKLDHKGIIGVTMPGFGTTSRTHGNANKLMEALGVTQIEISINDAVKQHFHDIDHDPAVHDVTYENSQARERTQLLMDIANKENCIVVGTGDLSELALGWCTYNGDHMSMYAVNASIPKTLVKYLVEGYAQKYADAECAEVLMDIVNTPISPELLPANEDDTIGQKTEDLVGPYELHDFFLYNMLRYNYTPSKIYWMACKAFNGVYDSQTIKHWLRTFYRRFFNQQFKRSCIPDGVKVGSICLSPRGDWRMPSDASSRIWLDEVEKL